MGALGPQALPDRRAQNGGREVILLVPEGLGFPAPLWALSLSMEDWLLPGMPESPHSGHLS